MKKNSLTASLASFVREKLTSPLLPHSVVSQLNRNDRQGALYRAWGYIFSNQIHGAYYEFGAYWGDSFRAAYRVCDEFRSWQRDQLSASEPWRRRVAEGYAASHHYFYAFDTFAGMPSNDEDNPVFAQGNFACSLADFSRLNAEAGIQEGPGVRYFAGEFSEVARKQGPVISALEPAALINLDCDLYSSTRDALALVGPKIQQGTVLLMDDWNHFKARPDAGSRKALGEFLERRADLSIEAWFAYEFVGQAFFIHRRGPQ